MSSKQCSYSVALLVFRRFNLVVLALDWWHSFCLFCHLLCIFSTFGICISIPNCTPNSFAYQIIISYLSIVQIIKPKKKNQSFPYWSFPVTEPPRPENNKFDLPKTGGKNWGKTSPPLSRRLGPVNQMIQAIEAPRGFHREKNFFWGEVSFLVPFSNTRNLEGRFS